MDLTSDSSSTGADDAAPDAAVPGGASSTGSTSSSGPAGGPGAATSTGSSAGSSAAKRVGPVVAMVAIAWLLKKLFGRRRG